MKKTIFEFGKMFSMGACIMSYIFATDYRALTIVGFFTIWVILKIIENKF